MSLNFLTYSSRSGSTFLSHQIARRMNVVVVPEFQFLYRVAHLESTERLDHSRACELVANDRQLDWFGVEDLSGIPPEDLTVSRLTREVVAKYPSGGTDAPSEQFLLKLGGVLHLWGDIARHFPDARALNVIRDGRAVVNSVLRTDSPYLGDGVSMGYGDAWRAAKVWSNDVAVTDRISAGHPGTILKVSYAEAVRDVDSVLAEIGEFFGWEDRREPRHAFGVRSEEQDIHRLAAGAAESKRLEGWREELAKRDRVVVETLCGRELAENGHMDTLKIARGRRVAYIGGAFIEHCLIQARHIPVRVKNIRSRQEFVDKVRTAFRRKVVQP